MKLFNEKIYYDEDPFPFPSEIHCSKSLPTDLSDVFSGW